MIPQRLDSVPENIRNAVRNNGRPLEHSLFWTADEEGGGGEPKGNLAGGYQLHVWSLAGFQEKLAAAGWAALVPAGRGWSSENGKLAIDSTPNQDTPYLLAGGGKAVLGLDVWNMRTT